MKHAREMFAMTAARRRVARIGTPGPARALQLSYASRQALLETAHDAALSDTTFRDLVARGDGLRDQRNWIEAAEAYGSALKLYPYERTYWTQFGHMVKEQECFGLAEIAYRTAAAFGAERGDVLPHLRFVMERQGASESNFPIRFHEPLVLHRQVPGNPDLLALARLLWGALDVSEADQLCLLRTSASLDEMVATMIADPRFEKSNRVWLELLDEGEL
jgi:hypothetical protein